METCTSIEETLDASVFKPQEDHFQSYKTNARSESKGYSLVKFSPLKEKVMKTQEDLEILEFLARNLFIHKSTPWTTSLK